MKQKVFIIAIMLLSVVGIYPQAAKSEIETFSIESYGEIEYKYVFERKACNCFFQALNKKSGSISLSSISCNSLKKLNHISENDKCK